ncbi:hypothetical protein KYI11_10710 [Macrococcoides bohemicum]|uniref:DUF7365 domain-containing protein n=1 Tax=Macrococcoides bohemicum TaxID=1903056 RepID=A0AAJ4TW39_9STAP|nr:hypothetical protein [Macrococcus bohemicus]QYA42055.1 hypothetical protein KYI11_10710 [Macrococcus bohemicus]
MEDAILNWIVKVAIPLITFAFVIFNKSKDNERRITKIEQDNIYQNKEMEKINTRLVNVENNYAILIRVEEQLKTLFKQNEEIKQEVKQATSNNKHID